MRIIFKFGKERLLVLQLSRHEKKCVCSITDHLGIIKTLGIIKVRALQAVISLIILTVLGQCFRVKNIRGLGKIELYFCCPNPK